MKKIMKKALSLALALVMVFTLAPMTAMAAESVAVGTEQTAAYTAGGEFVVYEYEATENGVLTLTINSIVCDGGMTICQINYGDVYSGPIVANQEIEIPCTQGTIYTIQFFEAYDSCDSTVTFTSSFVEGEVQTVAGQSFADAIDITNTMNMMGTMTATAYKDTTTYFVATGFNSSSSGKYTVTVDGGRAAGQAYFSVNALDANGTSTESASGFGGASVVASSYFAGGVIFFSVDNLDWNNNYDLQVSVTPYEELPVEPDEPVMGTSENPVELVLDETIETVLTADQIIYYYTYTAEEAGTLKVTMLDDDCTNGWVYSISGTDDAKSVYCESTYPVEELINPGEYAATAGETLTVWVASAEWGAGTVAFEATFTPSDDEPIVTGPTFTEEAENAALSSETLQLGEDEYATSLHEYTVYSFEPTEIGKYTITAENGLVGIVSNNGMWITIDPSAETVAENTLVWECTGVGQSIWVAVKTNDDAVSINVTREELVIEEIPEIDYADEIMEAEPEKYTFDGKVEDLEMVIYVADKTGAAKDENGFYHLVPAEDLDDDGKYIGTTPIEDCPLILVKLNDPTVSLAAAIGYGDVVYVDYDTTVDPIKANYILNFNKTIEKYIAASDTAANLYPLTDDLLTIMVLVGENNNWYGETGAVTAAFENDGIAEGDLITFAMYYMEAAEDEAPAPAPIIPGGTGDATNIALWIAVLGLGVVAIAGSVVMRKREF